MDKEKDFSDWVRQESPDDLNRFAIVEDSYTIFLDTPNERAVHEELESNKGNLTQNLGVFSGYSPKFMARAWFEFSSRWCWFSESENSFTAISRPTTSSST